MAFLYAGTFPRAYRSDTTDVAFGVYVLRIDPATGELHPAGLAETPRSGWVTAHPTGRFLYVANEVEEFEGRPGGGVSAFSVDPVTGALSPLNTRPTGAAPCHCTVDATGRYLLVSTFHGGTVHLFPLGADGRIGPALDVHQHEGTSVHPRRQAGPHAHSVTLDPANRFALVADLGTDRVVGYELDTARGRLVPSSSTPVTPGSGPRHLAFHPGGAFAYLVNEMAASVTVFGYGGGLLRELQTMDLLPDGFTGHRSAAGIAVHPSGRFLYATTRSRGSSGPPPEPGLDSVVWFEIGEDGGLTPRGRTHSGGEIARSLVLDPAGERLYVAHQGSGTIVTFRIGDGEPVPAGQVTATPVPVCLQIIE